MDILERCQRAMEKSMLGITELDKEGNTYLRARTDVIDILTKIN